MKKVALNPASGKVFILMDYDNMGLSFETKVSKMLGETSEKWLEEARQKRRKKFKKWV